MTLKKIFDKNNIGIYSTFCKCIKLIMSILKKDIKRITMSISKNSLKELNAHLKNFALIDRSLWILGAIEEKMGRERQLIKKNK